MKWSVGIGQWYKSMVSGIKPGSAEVGGMKPGPKSSLVSGIKPGPAIHLVSGIRPGPANIGQEIELDLSKTRN